MTTTQRLVLDGNAESVRAFPACEHVRAAAPACVPTIADRVPATEIMTRDIVCARGNLPVAELVKLMLRRHFGCIPIVDDHGHPRGMVTKTDLIALLIKRAPPVETTCAADVMMPLAIVLDERATVAHCAMMMASEDFHHVMIVSCTGALIGVVTSQDIVRWVVANDSVCDDS